MTDLAHLLLPHLTLLLTTLIRLTAPSPLHSANPHILQRVYDVLGALFRDLARDILAADGKEDGESQPGGLRDVWEVVRRGLGAPARTQGDDGAPQEPDDTQRDMQVDPVEQDVGGSDEEEEEEEAEPLAPVASTSARVIDDAEPRAVLHRTLPVNFRTTPQTRRLLGNSFSYLVRKAKPTALPDTPSELSLLFDFVVRDVSHVVELDGGERPSGRGAKGRGKGKGKGRGQEEGNSNIFAEGITWFVSESCTVSSLESCISHRRRNSHSCVPGRKQPVAFASAVDPSHADRGSTFTRVASEPGERDPGSRYHHAHVARAQDGAPRSSRRRPPQIDDGRAQATRQSGREGMGETRGRAQTRFVSDRSQERLEDPT